MFLGKDFIQLTKMIHYHTTKQAGYLKEETEIKITTIKAIAKMDALPDIRKITFISSDGHYNVFWTMFF